MMPYLLYIKTEAATEHPALSSTHINTCPRRLEHPLVADCATLQLP